MSRSAAVLLALFALGTAIGFGFSQLRTGPRDDRPAATPIARTDGGSASGPSAILAGRDPARRMTELSAWLLDAKPDALASLFEAIDASAVDGGDPELALVGLWWARFDPEAAYRWIRVDWRAQFANVIGAVFRGWALADPARALSMTSDVRYRIQRRFAVDAALSGWDESGRPGMPEAFGRLEDIDLPGARATLARRRVGELGPAGAIAWLEKLEDPTLRESLAMPVASAAAAVKGGGPVAANWVTPRIQGAEHRTGYPAAIGTRWSRRDPQAAIAWVKGLPAGIDRDEGIGSTYAAWMGRDGPAAFAWAEKLEPEPWNEPAIAVYSISQVVYGGAERSLATVARFSNTELRDSTMTEIVRAWVDNDPEAARAWVASADLPSATRERLTALTVPRRAPQAAANPSATPNAQAPRGAHAP